jgi:Type II CAAX prenyl endopeptidase Rce1-like
VHRPAFWIALGLLSVGAAAAAAQYFPHAFSIVALDITMDRERALSEARAIAQRDGRGPANYRQAASFGLDTETQTFVELEGGGKDAFTRMLRDELYAAYTWRVRHFRESETNETVWRFTPNGRPYGFLERVKEDAPGAALDAADARRRAEEEARVKWQIDLGAYVPLEPGLERRPGGRVDHTFIYERLTPTLNEGRYRLRLVMSGDRLTEVTHFVKIPEAFTRRYQNMRSANEAIGIGSAVGMVLLYVIGGIGIGLFFMLRRRWVLWRQAAVWGAIVGGMQALAIVNDWPLLWMTYDTAIPRSTYILQQISLIVVTLVGFSAFLALSFMAAESLTRRAFGDHPQLWRVWAKGPGSSTAILSRTIAGFLLVPIFFAYDVGLYFFGTRVLGWWTPSEALIHPDVLASYVPWFSAIAVSLQAGFWEECLFRAVPIAGAALIGDRLGRRRLFIVIAFVVQSIIFGAGHAPYPTLPSFARPVELIIPSIGFGLLYVYYGLLPAIVLHFAFDVVWFALPIFLADAPGIFFQRLMLVVMTLVPLWVVLWRRMQVGRWTKLAPSDRNVAWTPPPAPVRQALLPIVAEHAISPRVKKAWLGVGLASLAIAAVALALRGPLGSLPLSRADAADIARRALVERGVTLDSRWRVLPVPDEGSGGPHEFVIETAGEARWRELVGAYLPKPRWVVRVATFEGDVAERAEEWQVFVTDTGQVRSIQHRLPEGRAGRSLTEEAARRIAQEDLKAHAMLDVAQAQAREVSARPAKLTARTDWTFTFADLTIVPLPQGEPRIDVEIAGDEVAARRRYIHVPEEWARKQRAAATRNLILPILVGLVFGGLLVASAVMGVIAWSRHRYSPRVFVAAAALMFAISLASGVNNWPTVLNALDTSQPFQLQVAGLVGIGLVALTITAVLVGLALGAVPNQLAGSSTLPDREAMPLGIAAGLFGAAVLTVAGSFRTPQWARTPDLSPLGSLVPTLDVAIQPIAGFLMQTAIILSLLASVNLMTAGWTRRRGVVAIGLLLVGFLGAGGPVGSNLTGWLAAALLTSGGLLLVYSTLLRADLTIVPVALGTMLAIGSLARGMGRAFPGALPASILAAALIAGIAWWWFHALRRARARAVLTSAAVP